MGYISALTCYLLLITFGEHDSGVSSLIGQRAQQDLLQYNGQAVDVGGRRACCLGVVRGHQTLGSRP